MPQTARYRNKTRRVYYRARDWTNHNFRAKPGSIGHARGGSLRRKWNAWKYDRRQRRAQRSYSRSMRNGGWSNGRECYKCGKAGHFAVACRNC